MPVPRELLQEAFATLSSSTLHRVAEHNGIHGHEEMSPSDLALRLGRNDGGNLQSYSSKFSLPELKGIANVFGIDHRKQNKAALSNAVWLFIHDYDTNQEQGNVKSLDDALSRATYFQQFEAVRDRIALKFPKPSMYDSLRHGEKLLWHISTLVCEVDNGGFEQYLTNSTGNYAQETIGCLEEIQATSTGTLLKSIAEHFPGGVIPKDRKKRCDYLKKWERKSPTKAEAFFDNLDSVYSDNLEDLTKLAVEYVRKRREDFV